MESLIPQMSEQEWALFSRFIEQQYGIKVPFAKKVLLESRLFKRLHKLHMDSFTDYYDYLMSERGLESELFVFVDLISTHKTDFFREPRHYDFLVRSAFPELERRTGSGEVRIWSAACSTGEEPYSIAMTARGYEERQEGRGLRFSVLATDLSTEVLDTAFRAVYPEEKIADIPEMLRKKYLLRSKNRALKKFRICPLVRQHVSFMRLNLMDASYRFNHTFDIIFCCNVFIYFKRPVQAEIVGKMAQHLNKGGYFIVGGSESILGMNRNFKALEPSIYKMV